ncbi:cysteine--tRNA ligase [Yunchengibacter salinarum]|uniref:cysteine--tRNA ligase n=1 Tax=Yunchengibacter salinarum TaxID=3133399 RepID=UPI0035B67A03
MELAFYNTLTRRREPFVPGDPANVRLYVCGPTVYDFAHIGNARPVVVFDVLYRLLRQVYGSDHVTYARNITDIDDRIMERAAEAGESVKALTRRFADAYREDMAALGTLMPDLEPRATEHLPQMIAMIRTLIEKGHAYEAEGHVLFDISSMPDYGALSRHSQDELEAGARVEVAPYKRNPADFVLWKPSSDDQPGWGSPWGRGRPGWHLECSCMIEKHLGDTIDIHGGGQDLIFPHHENEIAQSQCAHDKPFVRTWMHNGYLTVAGEKMSKSLGNFHTVRDLLKDHAGEAIRMVLLAAHYRQPVDFSMESLSEQRRHLDRWYRLTDGVEAAPTVPESVLAALAQDVNTPEAIAALDALARPETADQLKAGAQFMGFLNQDAAHWFQAAPEGLDVATIDAAIEERNQARRDRNFARADRIRDDLLAKGVALEDGANGTTWRRAD